MNDEVVKFTSWAFGGIGVAVIGWLGTFFLRKRNSEPHRPPSQMSVSQTVNLGSSEEEQKNRDLKKYKSVEDAKGQAKLLFIDDDTRFNVVKILRKSGWKNTDIIKDIANLDDAQLKFADVVFVDIQGVGKLLNFKDEGLGLSMAIKDRYPEKYLVIYSSERSGNRFDEAIRRADDQLYKLADSYEFEKCVHNLLIKQ